MTETTHDLVVVGGGPAGSAAAAVAAHAGLDVLLLEAGRHPREHVGESMLPGIIPVLAEMDALDAIRDGGFEVKTGSTHYGWGRTARWDLWFADTEAYDHAWFVERSRFDEVLFERAAAAGAQARQEAIARGPLMSGERVVGVRWVKRGESDVRVARARCVVDATGRAATVTADLTTRSVIEGLKHRAAWAHWDGASRLAEPRGGQGLFVARDDHWLWCFPLDGDRASVGVVHLDAQGKIDYDAVVAAAPDVMAMLGAGARRSTPVRFERDWSYEVPTVTGPGWIAAGDAAGFIDPVLSTGVFLAMQGGRNAAEAAIQIAGGADEAAALGRYQSAHEDLFGNLLRIVRFFYQQNLTKDDYFWESKRILMRRQTELRPQKAFLVLTSGLVRNLALDDLQDERTRAREHDVRHGRETDLDDGVPEQLRFVCLHLEHVVEPRPAPLYFLIEPADPRAPTLFRTRSWHINCLAPCYDNDPILVPALQQPLRALHAAIDQLDDRHEPLADFWLRCRAQIALALDALPTHVRVVRVFGE